jgi:hypothetical protein
MIHHLSTITYADQQTSHYYESNKEIPFVTVADFMSGKRQPAIHAKFIDGPSSHRAPSTSCDVRNAEHDAASSNRSYRAPRGQNEARDTKHQALRSKHSGPDSRLTTPLL